MPIIISETEKITASDLVLLPSGEIFQMNHDDVVVYLASEFNSTKKILTLPEQFSHEQLQLIVDDELKDGDKVFLECEKKHVSAVSMSPTGLDHHDFEWGEIKLVGGHINLISEIDSSPHVILDNKHETNTNILPNTNSFMNHYVFRGFLRTHQLTALWEKYLRDNPPTLRKK